MKQCSGRRDVQAQAQAGTSTSGVQVLGTRSLKHKQRLRQPTSQRIKRKATGHQVPDLFTLIKFYKVKGDCLG